MTAPPMRQKLNGTAHAAAHAAPALPTITFPPYTPLPEPTILGQQNRALAFCEYGDYGCGKTRRIIEAGGDRCLYIGRKGCYSAAASLQFQIPEAHVADEQISTLDDVMNVMDWYGTEYKDVPLEERPWWFLGVDDVRILLARTWAQIKVNIPKSHSYDRFDLLQEKVDKWTDLGREVGWHMLTNSHIKLANDKKGKKGGPDTPSWQATEDYVASMDTVTYCEPMAQAPVYGFLWRGKRGKDDPAWYVKDRYDAIWGHKPPSLAEYMRRAGFLVPRAEGFEWMEEYADDVVARIVAGGKPADVHNETVIALMNAGVSYEHAYWASFDGVCRYGYGASKAERLKAQAEPIAGGAGGRRPPPLRKAAPVKPIPDTIGSK